VFDVDGVLTDGSVFLREGDGGESQKRFSVRDGLGVRLLRQAGLPVAFVSGRTSGAVLARAQELDVRHVIQGADDKLAAVRDIALRVGVGEEEVAYMGDDLPDLPVLRRVGYAMAPADAVHEVREVADLVTATRAGCGCVREAAEAILRAQDRWASVVERFLT
jgi:3-deoxy-D-manno-octulosonate 8-phosphate phosphatase (KDO 8-P phosphatase)